MDDPTRTMWAMARDDHDDSGECALVAYWCGAGLGDDEVLLEVRDPTPDDLPDLAGEVAWSVSAWLGDELDLSHAEGCPVLDCDAFADDIRDALMAALRRHVDLSEAAMQPTGRKMTVGEAKALLRALPRGGAR